MPATTTRETDEVYEITRKVDGLSDQLEALSLLYRYAADIPTEYGRDVAKAVRLAKATELLRTAARLLS